MTKPKAKQVVKPEVQPKEEPKETVGTAEPMSAEEIKALMEDPVTAETLQVEKADGVKPEVQPKEEPKEVVIKPTGVLTLDHSVTVGAARHSIGGIEVRLQESLTVPEGYVGLIKLSKEVSKRSHLRMTGDSLITPEESKQPLTLVLSNGGLDAVSFKKGTEIAEYAIVKTI